MSYIRLSTRPFLSVIEKKWIAFQLMSAVEQARENLFYVLTLIVFRESSTNLKTKYRWYLFDVHNHQISEVPGTFQKTILDRSS